MLSRLLLFHLRGALSWRTAVVFVAIVLLTAFVYLALPDMSSSGGRSFFDISFSIVDPESSLISTAIAEILHGMNDMGHVYLEDLETALERLERNEILMVIEFPVGFLESSQALEKRPPVTLRLNPRMPAESALALRELLGVADSIAGILAPYMSFASTIQPLYQDSVAYHRQLERSFAQLITWVMTRRAAVTLDETHRLNTGFHLVSSLLCLLCMQTGLMLLSQTEADSLSGVNVRLALSSATWFLSPLARGIAGFFTAGASFVPLFIGLKARFPESQIGMMVGAFLCLYWITATLCQAAGYLAGGSVMALSGTWLAILALLLLGGCIYPETLMPGFLRPLMPLSPAYHAYRAVYAALQGLPVPEQMPIAMTAMAVVSAVLLWLAWRRGGQAGARMGVA